jgi:hypothetical protein
MLSLPAMPKDGHHDSMIEVDRAEWLCQPQLARRDGASWPHW